MMRWLQAGAAGALAFAGVAFAAEPAGQEAAAGGLPQLNAGTYAGQIFWLLVFFFVLYLLLSRVFLPRLGSVIEERRSRIADDFDKAAEFKRQADEAEAGYKKALADARANASKIAAETRAQIDADIRAMQAETDKKLDADIDAAETRIAETSAKAAATVREAAKVTTSDIVVALIDETPSDETIDAALETARGAQ
ncbi:MAG: F0F1 ATP synthase subunit B' [Pseudomonadota bacterium]